MGQPSTSRSSDRSFPYNERRERIATRRHAYTPDLSYSLLRVNHYWTKSEDSHREKWATPDPEYGRLREPLPDRHLDLLNRERDDSIQIYLPALTEAIRRRDLGISTAQSSLDPGQVR